MESRKLGKAVEEYDDVFPTYNLFTDKIEKLVIDLLDLGKIKYHFVESRTKDRASFIEKINRPGKSYSNPLEELPDISGLRIVVYYADNIEKVAEIIRNEFEIIEKELSHQINKYAPDKFGYLSVHYVASLNNERSLLPEWQAYRDFHFEIQIRTVLQHSWAAISHALQYKRETDVPAPLQRKLFRLAGLLEIADDEFLSLRDSVKNIENDSRESIKEGDSSAEINTITIAEFISAWDKLGGIKTKMKKLGYNFEEEDFLIEDGYSDQISSIVYHLKRLSVRSIGEFTKLLNYNPIPFLEEAYDRVTEDSRSWTVSDEFVVLLMLIRSEIDNFDQKTLMENDAWGDDTADSVIIAAKNDSKRKLRAKPKPKPKPKPRAKVKPKAKARKR